METKIRTLNFGLIVGINFCRDRDYRKIRIFTLCLRNSAIYLNVNTVGKRGLIKKIQTVHKREKKTRAFGTTAMAYIGAAPLRSSIERLFVYVCVSKVGDDAFGKFRTSDICSPYASKVTCKATTNCLKCILRYRIYKPTSPPTMHDPFFFYKTFINRKSFVS